MEKEYTIKMKKFLVVFALILLSSCKEDFSVKQFLPFTTEEQGRDYSQFHEEALKYAKNKNLSTDFYILIDFSIHSGKKRFFIVDFKTKKIKDSFITTHGMGMGSSEEAVVFSNIPNSHTSSKGKYILGKEKVYSPGYRYKYIMYGKENSNSNAVVRNVVFHPWNVVPSEETYPNSIPMSWGCPAVSEDAFEQIDQKIQRTNKRVLMWIID